MIRSTFTNRRSLPGRAAIALTVLATALLSLLFVPRADAVHDVGVFELDGNAVNDAVAGQDWADVYTAQTASTPGCPTGTTACSFVNDGAPNATIFTGGGSRTRSTSPPGRGRTIRRAARQGQPPARLRRPLHPARQ